MTSRLASCPHCTSSLVEIRLSDDLAMRSCSVCEQRWWQRGGSGAALEDALEAVGAMSGRRRAG